MEIKKETKIGILILLTFTFFILELVGGYVTGSIALVADSFHMLSDVAALIVALVATRLVKSKNFVASLSYGLQRAEVLGALINGVSLLALCFTLVISAIQRLFVPEEITNPYIVLYVASAGLVVNIIGIFLFHDHAHSHSHDTHFKRIDSTMDPTFYLEDVENPIYLRENVIRVAEKIMENKGVVEYHRDQDHVCGVECADCVENEGVDNTKIQEQGSATTIQHDEDGHHDHDHHHHDMNMHGVFLHVLGDLLASVGVILSAVVLIFVKQPWTRCIHYLTCRC